MSRHLHLHHCSGVRRRNLQAGTGNRKAWAYIRERTRKLQKPFGQFKTQRRKHLEGKDAESTLLPFPQNHPKSLEHRVRDLPGGIEFFLCHNRLYIMLPSIGFKHDLTPFNLATELARLHGTRTGDTSDTIRGSGGIIHYPTFWQVTISPSVVGWLAHRQDMSSK